jgi:hypothetical protein
MLAPSIRMSLCHMTRWRELAGTHSNPFDASSLDDATRQFAPVYDIFSYLSIRLHR